jgi:hypothetical protein
MEEEEGEWNHLDAKYIAHVHSGIRDRCTTGHKASPSVWIGIGEVSMDQYKKRGILPTAAHTLRRRLIICAT